LSSERDTLKNNLEVLGTGLRLYFLDSIIFGSYSGKNIAETVLSIIHRYKLTGNRIRWFMLDNASSNDTCVVEILKSLQIDNTAERRRLRCLGHVINLATQAFYLAQMLRHLTKISTKFGLRKIKESRSIGEKGHISKPHNVMGYICRTPQQKRSLKRRPKESLKSRRAILS
jgi:hypothetical protein